MLTIRLVILTLFQHLFNVELWIMELTMCFFSAGKVTLIQFT